MAGDRLEGVVCELGSWSTMFLDAMIHPGDPSSPGS